MCSFIVCKVCKIYGESIIASICSEVLFCFFSTSCYVICAYSSICTFVCEVVSKFCNTCFNTLYSSSIINCFVEDITCNTSIIQSLVCCFLSCFKFSFLFFSKLVLKFISLFFCFFLQISITMFYWVGSRFSSYLNSVLTSVNLFWISHTFGIFNIIVSYFSQER